MKLIKVTEVTHQWKGTAITRNSEGQLNEVKLGVIGSDKKLKETGAKELFRNLPTGTITLEVEKLADISITYEVSVEEFKKIAKVVKTPTETPVEATAEGETK
jgi:hypothetical protein